MKHKPQTVGPFSYESGSDRIKYRINHEQRYFYRKFAVKHGGKQCVCSSHNDIKTQRIELKSDIFKFVFGDYKPKAGYLIPCFPDDLEPFF